jgi:hypothetical protein
MYIEDILSILRIQVATNQFDSKLIESFYDQICKGSGLTEKQASVALNITRKYINKLNTLTGKDLTAFLDNPTYKLGIRTITKVKTINIIPHTDFKKAIQVQFPFDEKLLDSIKKEKPKLGDAAWNSEAKSWIFPLNDASIQFLSSWVEHNNFIADAEFLEYVEQAKLINANIENYIPMLTYDGKNVKIVNSHASVPQPTSSNIVTSLFEARRAGIVAWDTAVDTALGNSSESDIVKDFIKSDIGTPFSVNLETTDIFSITPIVKHIGPCVIVVPGGNELSKLQLALALLHAADIKNEEISVLFRLSKEDGSDFNEFVRNEKLNSPLSSTTKAVFISAKIPKTMVESKLKFNCVINFNFYNIHYTIRDFLKNSHNVINVISNKKQKEIASVFM